MLFLINLDGAVQRHRFMAAQLQSAGIEFTRIGIDLRHQAQAEIYARIDALCPQFAFALDRLSGAEIGCWLSHLSAWKSFLEHGTAPMCTVIEDDMRLEPDFADAMRAIRPQSTYDLIYLGTSSKNLSSRRRTPIDRFWVHEPVGAIFNTWAYSIAREYVERVFAAGPLRIDVPIDHFLGGKPSCLKPRIAVLRPTVVEEDCVLGNASQIGPHTLRVDRWRLVERARRRLLASRMGRYYYELYRLL